MAETDRRREKQKAYNDANGITPTTIKRDIANILGSVYEQDHVTVEAGFADEAETFIGHNLRAHIAELERRMKDAASNLEFEEAGRLRDEIRRLQATELAIADDPLARQQTIERKAADMTVEDLRRGATLSSPVLSPPVYGGGAPEGGGGGSTARKSRGAIPRRERTTGGSEEDLPTLADPMAGQHAHASEKKTGRAKSDTSFEVRPHKLKGKRLARPNAPKTFGSRRK